LMIWFYWSSASGVSNLTAFHNAENITGDELLSDPGIRVLMLPKYCP